MSLKGFVLLQIGLEASQPLFNVSTSSPGDNGASESSAHSEIQEHHVEQGSSFLPVALYITVPGENTILGYSNQYTHRLPASDDLF